MTIARQKGVEIDYGIPERKKAAGRIKIRSEAMSFFCGSEAVLFVKVPKGRIGRRIKYRAPMYMVGCSDPFLYLVLQPEWPHYETALQDRLWGISCREVES